MKRSLVKKVFDGIVEEFYHTFQNPGNDPGEISFTVKNGRLIDFIVDLPKHTDRMIEVCDYPAEERMVGFLLTKIGEEVSANRLLAETLRQ